MSSNKMSDSSPARHQTSMTSGIGKSSSGNGSPSISSNTCGIPPAPPESSPQMCSYFPESRNSSLVASAVRLGAFDLPGYSRSGSLTSVRTLPKERTMDMQNYIMGERSLDRRFDSRLQFGSLDRRALAMSINSRDRSLDRDYPHMGARSLEREYQQAGGRSRSWDRSDQYGSRSDQYGSRENLVLEMQIQLAELTKDCAKLQDELQVSKDKLSSCMNSIKTFWSPELKKERALRKEESAKYNLMNEQLKVSQAELKKQCSVVKDIECQLKMCQSSQLMGSMHQDDSGNLQKDQDQQSKDLLILKKTIEEMEIRIDTQKQTLVARDESIKKLLEMLQSKGLAVHKIEEERLEKEKMRTHSAELDRKNKQLLNSLDQKEKELSKFKEEKQSLSEKLNQSQLQLKQQPASTHTMQAILEAKDSRIAALEKELQHLEDRMFKWKEDGTLDRKNGTLKDTLSSKEKALREETENIKQQMNKRDTIIAGLKMKAETLENQQSENNQYIKVLKEQISAKELHSSMLQADIEDQQTRLKEKDSILEKKGRQIQNLQAEKRKLETDLSELRDHLDIKDRKINVLQRKIDNLEEAVKEKEEQLEQTKARIDLESLNSTDRAVATLEESITEKERLIERYKEQRERTEKEYQEESETYEKAQQELKTKIESLQNELAEKQTELCELREEAAELRSERFQTSSKIRELESHVSDRLGEVTKLRNELDEYNQGSLKTKYAKQVERKLEELTLEIQQLRDDYKKSHSEVERLTGLVKDTEAEKCEKDIQIKELQDLVKDYKQKVGTLKRNQQTEKKKNAQLLEEARKREGNLSEDQTEMKSTMTRKAERIEELEEALRESVKITAEREMVLAEKQTHLDESLKKIEQLTCEHSSSTETKDNKISALTKQLEEKEVKLKRLQNERHKHLEEVYEMKQEAIQAAICEKDANIALIEMTSTKKVKAAEQVHKLCQEKEKLQIQLKDLTQSRIKLLHKEQKSRSRRSSGSRKNSAEHLVDHQSLPNLSHQSQNSLNHQSGQSSVTSSQGSLPQALLQQSPQSLPSSESPPELLQLSTSVQSLPHMQLEVHTSNEPKTL